MGWMKVLCDTYDKNSNLVADYISEFPLCPVAHIEATAQIEITIDGDGNFRRAVSVDDKANSEFFIPVTEESAGRSSGIAPHALYDNLTYVAGDYEQFTSTEKEASTSRDRFREYSKLIKEWAASEYSHPHIKAIYRYIDKKCMVRDLIDAGVVTLEEKGKLSKDKIAGKPYEKCVVRFIVQDGIEPDKCWHDKELIRLYQEYYFKMKLEKDSEDICYLTGEKCIISNNHPKGIIPASYGAKLISANDTADFTFRGRFSKGEEAYAVGFEATQKAHNALRWLAKMQGYTVGTTDKRTYICWNPDGKRVPEPDSLFDYGEEEADENLPKSFQKYRDKLRSLINGYADYFEESDNVTIMALEAATTGRLSIVYYNELNAKDFLNRVREWNEGCCWSFPFYDTQKKPRQAVNTPSIKRIVNYAFGVEQDKNVKVSDKLMIMQYQRLFHCIVDKQRIPRDFVEAIFQRANHFIAYSRGNRDRLLSTACALISKYYRDYHGGEIKMELDRNLDDRSYLYGRLLAVYEQVERRTYDYEENREPNAIRYQTAFSQHPATVRKVIEEQLLPYFDRLKVKDRLFYRKEIEEISNMFRAEDMKNINKQLDYLYLVGYWAERAALRKGKNEPKEENIDKEEEN